MCCDLIWFDLIWFNIDSTSYCQSLGSAVYIHVFKYWFPFKGVIGCKIHFTSCLNINVCWKFVYTSILWWKKFTECFIFNPYFKIPFLKSGCSEVPVRMTYFSVDQSHNSWLTRLSYLRPALSELRAVCHCVDSGARKTRTSPIKRLMCSAVGSSNKYSSRPTSEPLKMQRINGTFALKWMRWYRST